MMSDPLPLVLTSAGLDALVDAQNGSTEAIRIVEIGLSETHFDAAPTLVDLPGEIARIGAVHGQSVAANVIHMTATDAGATVYDLRGIGLYLADGTLFASYAQVDPLFRKVSIANFLLAFDIKFSGDVADVIEFGDANFTYPPASETVKGVARIATQDRVDAEADAGDDGETIVTPKSLRARLVAFFALVTQTIDDFIAAVTADIAALQARTIIGGGLATGGGDLSDNRVITVAAASAADVSAGISAEVALTPATLGPIGGVFSTFGYAREAGGKITQWGSISVGPTEFAKLVTLPLTFPNAILNVVGSYASNPEGGSSNDEADENLWLAPTSNGAITIFGSSADDYGNRTVSFQAIGY